MNILTFVAVVACLMFTLTIHNRRRAGEPIPHQMFVAQVGAALLAAIGPAVSGNTIGAMIFSACFGVMFHVALTYRPPA